MSFLSKEFNVTSNQIEISSRAARRLIFNSDILKNAKLCTGDIVAISSASGINSKKKFSIGIIWPSLDLPQDSVLVSTSLLLTACLVPGERAHVFPLTVAASAAKLSAGIPSLTQAKEADIVRLREISVPGSDLPTNISESHKTKQKDWLTLLLRETLVDLKFITNSQILEIQYEGHKRRFSLSSVVPKLQSQDVFSESFEALSINTTPQIWIVGWDSKVIIDDSQSADLNHKPNIEILEQSSISDAYASVGGLDKQIAEIRDLLEIPLTRPELFRYFGLKPPRGILLHGPPGTGKTHLARAIASSTKSSVLVVNGPELSSAYHGETESKLRDVFKEARDKSPCIIVLDEIDALVPRREDSAGGEVEKRVVATLLTLLDGMEGDHADGQGRVVVIGTTNRLNAIDPALRRPGRFDREIEIGIPDADARLSILNVLLSKTPHNISQEELITVASHAHGYVGADLGSVVREAGTTAIKKWLITTPENKTNVPPPSLALTFPDLIASLPSVRPSTMRSLFIDTPPIRYSDIGGQNHVIQKLREAVEWPLLHPEVFQRLGVKPPKGVLLYGPPGCSKTILARACACESGINFLAVKGPELLNKFVGESERAVREIFRKARAASPSIIFFDEIDALAISRTSSDQESGSSHEGVLTSLLNEMDGVQELIGVTILAATNRPEAIDSALMRPGRLDRLLYIGPPDHAGREEILRIRMTSMAVDPDINVENLAKLTDGFSGAEIMALCQEAAILTMHKDINASFIPQHAFTTAVGSIKRQITPTILQKFDRWRSENDTKRVM